ncbi:hypothetical protein [Hyphococcus sp.]|uniref:hypothetical protein n=1 Tax=Hyphococcus sp. TaxID=2038636 RepID=UPI00208A73F3|nr:MAG: hypothetical protein DHS20C04_32320 [Marinicaulis sp.]
MRTEWHFYYELQDYAFARERKFRGGPGVTDEGVVQIPEFTLRIIPDPKPVFEGPSETGQLHIEMPGDSAETKQKAIFVAVSVSQKIEFDHGSMKVHSAFITGKHIPETDQEKQQVKDSPYFAEARLIEVRPPETLPNNAIGALVANPKTSRLISTFNAARAARSPIDRFTGYFKVIEDIYSKSKSGSILNALKASQELFEIAYGTLRVMRGDQKVQVTRQEFNGILRDIVKARDNCSHLRTDIGLGLAPNDTRVRVEVEPLVPVLEDLARGAIRRLEQDGA